MKLYQKLGMGLATLGTSAAAMADTPTDPVSQVFGAISTSGIVSGVVALAVVGIGIALAFKAWSLGKKATNRI